MTSVASTRSRAHRWAQVFTRLASILDRLQQSQERSLACSLAHLLQRALDPFEGVRGDLIPHEFVGESLDVAPTRQDLVAGLMRCRGESGASSPGDAELDVLLHLAEAYRADAQDVGDGHFEDITVGEEALALEFRQLRHLDAQSPGPGLLPACMRAAWTSLHAYSQGIEEPEHRLQFDMARLRVIRALYSLAIGHRAIRSRPFLDADNLLLVHRLGESVLAGRSTEAHGRS